MAGATVKGYFMNERTGKLLPFIYNPEEFEYSYSTDYAVVKPPGSPHPLYQFVGGNERMINVTLLLDGKERHPTKIRDWENFFSAFHPHNAKVTFNPVPTAIFAMGTFVKRVIVTNVRWRYFMFDKNLNPIRAEVTVDMETVV